MKNQQFIRSINSSITYNIFYEYHDYDHSLCIKYIADDGLSCCDVSFYPDENCGIINNISVHKSAQNQGRATDLINLMYDEILNRGRDTAQLYCEPGTWQLDWYKRLGFEPIDVGEYSLILLEKSLRYIKR